MRIKPGALSGELNARSSKSHAQRLLVASTLSGGGGVIDINTLSQDILSTINCLRMMGADIEIAGQRITVGEIDRSKPSVNLDVGESGTLARIMLPLSASLYKSVSITGRGSLVQRPFADIINAIKAHNVSVSGDRLPLNMNGLLQPGEYKIPGNVSSQYISGLLFALPQLAGDSEIKLTTPLESKGYIDLTIKTLEDFGVHVEETVGGYIVPGDQRFFSNGVKMCENDWTNAAVWCAAGALSEGSVTVNGLDIKSPQGDKRIVELLKKFGACVDICGASCRVKRGNLTGIRVDARDIPDLVPVLALTACAALGETIIEHIGRLRFKESDRIDTVMRTLKALGGSVSATNDSLIIKGTGRLHGGSVSSYCDHRIVMMAALAACISDGDIVIDDESAVDKSYPEFFKDFESLGGKCLI